MLVARSPLRVSFLGGGSDVPGYYNKFPGMTLSATINKFIYVVLNTTPNQHTRLIYNQIEVVEDIEDLKHDIAREILKCYYPDPGMEIASFADVATIGTGLGSSSVFAVTLLTALNGLYGIPYTKFDVAEEACRIEIDVCKSPIGKQDAYATVFGGLNTYKFSKDGVIINPVNIHQEVLDDLQNNLLLFYTNRRRMANDILTVQNSDIKFSEIDKMVVMAEQAEKYLEISDLDSFGDLLDQAWNIKRNLAAGISDDEIDVIYKLVKDNGALGFKILGAGGGGYGLAYVPIEKQANVINALAKYDINITDFNFFDEGASVILNSRSEAF